MLYKDLNEVVEYINAHDNPLGLYFLATESPNKILSLIILDLVE